MNIFSFRIPCLVRVSIDPFKSLEVIWLFHSETINEILYFSLEEIFLLFSFFGMLNPE